MELNRDELVIACGSGPLSYLSVELMQFPGKKAHTISEILKSGKITIESIFT